MPDKSSLHKPVALSAFDMSLGGGCGRMPPACMLANMAFKSSTNSCCVILLSLPDLALNAV
jgi:hypothetical protein